MYARDPVGICCFFKIAPKTARNYSMSMALTGLCLTPCAYRCPEACAPVVFVLLVGSCYLDRVSARGRFIPIHVVNRETPLRGAPQDQDMPSPRSPQ